MEFISSVFKVFHPLDMVVTIVILVFALKGYRSGFLAILINVASVVGALLFAWFFYAHLGALIAGWGLGKVGPLLAFIAIFLASFILLRIVGGLIQGLTKITLIGWIDSVFGILLGAVQGLLISVFFIVLIVGIIKLFMDIPAFFIDSAFYEFAFLMFEKLINTEFLDNITTSETLSNV